MMPLSSIDYSLNFSEHLVFAQAYKHSLKSRKSHWIGMKRAAVYFDSAISHAPRKKHILSNLIFFPLSLLFVCINNIVYVKNQNGSSRVSDDARCVLKSIQINDAACVCVWI